MMQKTLVLAPGRDSPSLTRMQQDYLRGLGNWAAQVLEPRAKVMVAPTIPAAARAGLPSWWTAAISDFVDG